MTKRVVALFYYSVLIIVILTAPGYTQAVTGRWDILPALPKLRVDIQVIRTAAIDQKDVLWVTGNDSIFYWNGNQFRLPVGAGEQSPYGFRLYGGLDRQLYATQTDYLHHGRIYKLSNGILIPEAQYEVDNKDNREGFYVSKSSKIYRYDNEYVSVLDSGNWIKFSTPIKLLVTRVFEVDNVVYFYSNGVLVAADKSNNFKQRIVDVPLLSDSGSGYLFAALWHKDSVILTRHRDRQIYAFNLITAKEIPITESINSKFKTSDIEDVYSAADGSVWILQGYRDTRGFYRIAPDESISFEVNATMEEWESNRSYGYPKTFITANDGAIWMGLSKGGLIRWKDGKAERLDWKQGAPMLEIISMAEDSKGRKYTISNHSIYLFTPNAKPNAAPSETSNWMEIEGSDLQPVRDSGGGIWVTLKDHPGKLSRWDGYKWTHIDIDFVKPQCHYILADDREHIIISSMENRNVFWYDVSVAGVKKFESIENAVLAALKDGVKSFSSGLDNLFCNVLNDGTVAVYPIDINSIGIYAADHWEYTKGIPYSTVLPDSTEHSILLRSQDRQYLSFDKGKLTDLSISQDKPGRFLLGPGGFQPFDSKLLAMKPHAYFPFELDEKHTWWTIKRSGNNGEILTRAEKSPLGDWAYIHTSPGYYGGLWCSLGEHHQIHRAFGDCLFTCNFDGTPLESTQYDIPGAYEDAAGNLWIDAGLYGSSRHLFMRKAAVSDLALDKTPTTDGSHLIIKPVSISESVKNDRLFWRTEGGYWQGGTIGSAEIDISQIDKQNVEVVSMDTRGCISGKTVIMK